MNQLKTNISNLWGTEGRKWLKKLPDLVDQLRTQWELTDIQPVDNMTYNYVAKASHPGHGFVVLKVSFNEEMIGDEINALRFFSAHGMVNLIAHNPLYHAILLHQARPGNSLRSLYPKYIQKTVRAYTGVVKELISVPQSGTGGFRHIKEWLVSLENADKTLLPLDLLEEAIQRKEQLLLSTTKEYVLHGDLHHDNILSERDSWIAIDPKGIIGEVEFEVAAFDFLHDSELRASDAVEILQSRIKQLSSYLDLDLERLTTWIFVRLMLGATWSLEDKGDPSGFLLRAKVAHILLNPSSS